MFKLPELPYDKESLAPYISSKTLDYHHGKHHKAYVDNLNKFAEGSELENKSLEDIIMQTSGDASKVGIFNNAAQVWNHTFFWHSLSGNNGGGKPTGALEKQIEKDFDSYEKFLSQFKAGGIGQFGSGWVWLVWDEKDGKLEIMKTSNAHLPMQHGKKAIITADVWEHAYYLDYQNRRPEYLDMFLEHLINWEFAIKNFENK